MCNIHTYLPTYLPTYIHTYIHTHIHIYTYTHIHRQTYRHTDRHTDIQTDTDIQGHTGTYMCFYKDMHSRSTCILSKTRTLELNVNSIDGSPDRDRAPSIDLVLKFQSPATERTNLLPERTDNQTTTW